MAVNMETRPCVTDAWGSQYIEYHKPETGAWVELLLSCFSSIDLDKADKRLWWNLMFSIMPRLVSHLGVFHVPG